MIPQIREEGDILNSLNVIAVLEGTLNIFDGCDLLSERTLNRLSKIGMYVFVCNVDYGVSTWLSLTADGKYRRLVLGKWCSISYERYNTIRDCTDTHTHSKLCLLTKSLHAESLFWTRLANLEDSKSNKGRFARLLCAASNSASRFHGRTRDMNCKSKYFMMVPHPGKCCFMDLLVSFYPHSFRAWLDALKAWWCCLLDSKRSCDSYLFSVVSSPERLLHQSCPFAGPLASE